MPNLVIDKIYKEVFVHSIDQSIFVFLCGGAGKSSIRGKVREELLKMNLHILYPEDLFLDIINNDRSKSLLEMEEFLAINSDVIFIICESIGSAVELGAFTQNEVTRKKLIIAIEKKYSRNKSFVVLGPVRLLKKHDPKSVLTYKRDDLASFFKDAEKNIRKLVSKQNNRKNVYSFNNLSTYILFIPIAIFFYKSVLKTDLKDSLKKFIDDSNIIEENFDEHFISSIKYLLKIRCIQEKQNISENDKYQPCYELTKKGSLSVNKTLDNLHVKDKNFLINGIRLGIMKEQLYN